MRIAISTLTADPLGSHVLTLQDSTKNKLGDTARRVSRVATLDGGAALIDSGYSVADKTITLDLSWQDQEVIDDLRYLVSMYSTVLVFTEEGAYTAALERLTGGRTGGMLTLLVVGDAEIKAP